MLNAEMYGLEAARILLFAALSGFLIFTHGWTRALRSFWDWINLRNP